MKSLIKSALLTLLGIFFSNLSQAQQVEVTAVRQTILSMAKAADQSNATELDQYLDTNYRVVMNQLFGSTEVSILSKAVYLEKIRNREFGGDTREISIDHVVINGNSASAQVTFAGTKLTFVSLITLIKDQGGQWKLIGEIPTVR
jgi:hypothetical protein